MILKLADLMRSYDINLREPCILGKSAYTLESWKSWSLRSTTQACRRIFKTQNLEYIGGPKGIAKCRQRCVQTSSEALINTAFGQLKACHCARSHAYPELLRFRTFPLWRPFPKILWLRSASSPDTYGRHV